MTQKVIRSPLWIILVLLLATACNRATEPAVPTAAVPTLAVAAPTVEVIAATVQAQVEGEAVETAPSVEMEGEAEAVASPTASQPTTPPDIAPTYTPVPSLLATNTPTVLPPTATAIPTAIPTAVPPTAPPITGPATDMDSLRAKMNTAVADEAGNVTVTITDDELTQVIQSANATGGQANVSNPTVQFTAGTIVLSVELSEPSGTLEATFQPYVNNGVLQFEIVTASLNGRNVPPTLLATAETTLNSTLGEAMGNLPPAVQLTDVVVGEGTLTVMGVIVR